MGNGTFVIVPAQGREELLKMNVAGLSLAERLCRTARKAGIAGVLVITSRPELAGLSQDSSSPLVITNDRELADIRCEKCIVLKAGALPDPDFLKEIDGCTKPGKLYVADSPPAFFVCSSIHFSYVSTFFLRSESFDEAYRESAKSPDAEKLHVDRGRLYIISDPSDVKNVEESLFNGLIKDTEGFMSRHVERKISISISKRLVNTPVTPNQMTIFSILVGIAGAYLISLGTGIMQVAGSLLFLAHSILDGCDGEIARIKFMESRFGGVLDFWGDNVVHAAVFYGIGHAWHERTGEMLPLVLAWLAVISTFASASIVYFRTMRHKDEDDGPLYTSVASEAEKSQLVRLADFLSRRDFIYLVVILAIAGHLDWFLILAGVGSPIFLMVLVWLNLRHSHGSKHTKA